MRERLREATAEAILDAAEQAFAAEGSRARMESIAARAGIAVGTLYNHFADRDALWAALSRSRREALLVRLDGALEVGRGHDFPAALRGFLEALVGHWAAHRGFLNVLAQAEPSGRSPRAGVRARTMADELLSRAAALLDRGVDAGALRREDAALYPAALLGLVRGVLLHPPDQARDATIEVDALVRMFLAGAGA